MQKLPTGSVILMLHAHLPYVHHPEYEDFLEEDWLFEAISETYLPLLGALERLEKESNTEDTTLTISMSPPLCTMLRNPRLQERWIRRTERQIELARKETKRAESSREEQALAYFYLHLFEAQKQDFLNRDCQLIPSFAKLQKAGIIEICTCAATHGFLPLMVHQPQAMRAQIEVAVADYNDCFGQRPRGIWLPECGYNPEIEPFLRAQGIRYFFLDSHGIRLAKPSPKYDVHAPLFTPHGLAAFGRDPESSKQVWSATEGYPGDPNYREFYRDLGYERPIEYIKPHIQPTGERKGTGLKYHRITGTTDEKQWYRPALAKEKAEQHARHFVQSRQKQLDQLSQTMLISPMILCPYDAELFGHWWFEGPLFIENVLRGFSEIDNVSVCSPSQYLQRQKSLQLSQPYTSSWGAHGYAQVWLEPSNDWIYAGVENAYKRLQRAVAKHPSPNILQERVLAQMAREFLLAQSSDWAFLIQTKGAEHYAKRRIKDHLLRVQKLFEQLEKGKIDTKWLEEIEERDAIFSDIEAKRFGERIE